MIGIIGGTGLYQMDGIEEVESRKVYTPFGAPSAPLVMGKLGSRPVAFLPRHGMNHELLPSEINYRANIWALKQVGVRQVIAVSAVGSLVEEVEPGDLAIPCQYLDWTRGKRAGTFFGNGMVAHVSTAKPVCPALATEIKKTAHAADLKIHTGKTYACVEGPRLGTQAESFFLKSAGCDLVGMTNVPEVFLAREAQLCYCTIAIATDYDCWLDDPSQHVTVDKVIALYRQKLEYVKKVLHSVLIQSSFDLAAKSCGCRKSLAGAVLTQEGVLTNEMRRILEFMKG